MFVYLRPQGSASEEKEERITAADLCIANELMTTIAITDDHEHDSCTICVPET